MEMEQKEIAKLIIIELRKAIEYGRGLYNPELHRRLPSQLLGTPEALTFLQRKKIIFHHKGYFFFNPEYSRKTTDEILELLENDQLA